MGLASFAIRCYFGMLDNGKFAQNLLPTSIVLVLHNAVTTRPNAVCRLPLQQAPIRSLLRPTAQRIFYCRIMMPTRCVSSSCLATVDALRPGVYRLKTLWRLPGALRLADVFLASGFASQPDAIVSLASMPML